MTDARADLDPVCLDAQGAATFLHGSSKLISPFKQFKSFLHSQVERIWCSNAAGVASWGVRGRPRAGVRHEVPSFLLFRNLEYPHGACTVRALQVPTPPTLLHQFFAISLCRNHLILGITRTSCYTSRVSCYTALRGRPGPACAGLSTCAVVSEFPTRRSARPARCPP